MKKNFAKKYVLSLTVLGLCGYSSQAQHTQVPNVYTKKVIRRVGKAENCIKSTDSHKSKPIL